MTRLRTSTLPELQTGVAVPTYPREDRPTGIVHFGVGAFPRAHQEPGRDGALATMARLNRSSPQS